MTNLVSILTTSADRHGHRPAIRLDDVVLSHAELDDLSARAAGWLRGSGVEPGDRVGLMLPNIVPFAVLYYAVLRAGAIVVPMNPLLKAREVEHHLRDSGARLVLVSTQAAPEAQAAARGTGAEVVVADDGLVAGLGDLDADLAPVARADDDTAVILYTSGTTGSPKGAQLTHANLRLNALGFGGLIGLTEQDVVMGSLPLFHAFGQSNCLNASVAVGACLTLVPRFEAEAALRLVERDRVTVFAGVPTMYVTMLQAGAEGADTSSLRVCVSGGASLPVEVLRGVEETFGAPILEGYGLSETSPTATFNRPGRAKVGSIGIPIDGVEVRLVDRNGDEVGPGEVGEIVIRGHNVMKGYWGRPRATADAVVDGWFHSGDLATRDEDGFYYVVDRKKDLIIRGGFNVYPREIEEVLYAHPAVLEAAVVGVPHPTLGEEVAATVTLRPAYVVSAEELRDHVKARVAAYKYPRHVWVMEALPKGPTGKILKRDIHAPEAVTASAG
ncbi:long-chain-fatty-acid--CoA ligase [Nocardioides lacusdianchii]|uniref:long-chain-fatty-acid--CoA ligase n=1 Tax=Nocardioides lacusdianchii TaxID=2783664 RepID=UPI001CCF1C56|nr:long-chain fatty acid--CoA ligase [Nocardioides lacusdianchii]